MIPIKDLPFGFEVECPEIYQIEVSSACNFNCTICPRKLYPRKDKTQFIDEGLIQKLIDEGAFRGSYFVELQMSGEPTLHPHLDRILDLLDEVRVFKGLSTNGHDLSLVELLRLDYITVSIDSLDDRIRKGRQKNFVTELKNFINKAEQAGKPIIDLQLVEVPGWEQELRKVKTVLSNQLKSDICNIRTVPDCFLTKFNQPDQIPVSEQRCLNPWMSVSIQSNGNVTACCFSFGDDIILGNLYTQTLEEIWQGRRVKQLRREHETGRYRDICARCYMRSPVLLHWNIFMTSLKGGRK